VNQKSSKAASASLDARLRTLLHALGGALLIALSLFADEMLGHEPEWGALESLALIIGLVLALSGLIVTEGVLARVGTNLCLSLIALFTVVGIAEVFFRMIDFDFAYQERAYERTPPFYRQPIEPTGTTYFRRRGPEVWTGQVLNTQLAYYNVSPNPYVDEPPISVRYDSMGFRDSRQLKDWDVVVAGDSFTELGYLAEEQLFTSIIGELLDKRVRNLGVSQTGPFTHLSYLRDYGLAASTKHAMIVFFEGNDFWELNTEFLDEIEWRTTGEREYRRFQRQTSVLRAIDHLLQVPQTRTIGPDSSIQAYFHSTDGEIPITLVYSPPTAAEVLADESTVDAMEEFARSYSDFGNQNELTLWLAFMPSKLRAVHGHVRFADNAEQRFKRWEPNDLAQLVSDYCGRYGIRFIDLTQAIADETGASRTMLYNTIYDTHLNGAGSALVGRELARHMQAYESSSTADPQRQGSPRHQPRQGTD
jgi:hypothetical protein